MMPKRSCRPTRCLDCRVDRPTVPRSTSPGAVSALVPTTGDHPAPAQRLGDSGLRILLAHDLSPPAERAAALVTDTQWPGSTTVRVVSSPMGMGPPLSSFATPREARTHARAVRQSIELVQERVAVDLWDAGVTVERGMVPGRPERAIVADADWFGADLIVVGARDLGPFAARLLGSVSRAVVETSPCSVLVARGLTASRVLLAVDGSPPAKLAMAFVATWPLFRDSRIRVAGVGEAPPRSGAIMGDAKRRAAFRGTIEGSAPTANDVVDRAVDVLTRQGLDVEGEIRLGDVGTEIVEAARSWPADLVVIGVHAESPLRRLLRGTVARKILDNIGSSVLVARPRPERDGSAATLGYGQIREG
jgi:nucleotide-binding universal stress UspA family protein